MTKFSVGDIVKTRDGHKVKILCTDAPSLMPIVGIFLDGPWKGEAGNWHLDGAYQIRKACPLGVDLIPPKRTREVMVWANVYERTEHFLASKYAAQKVAGEDALAVAVPVTFTIEY